MGARRSFILSFICVFFINVLVADAGRQKRLLSAQIANTGDAKYIVSLTRWHYHICGGGLISEKHVLTGAHCFVGRVDPPYVDGLVVITGMMKLSFGGRNNTAAFVTVHADFKKGAINRWANDIAVVTLSKPIRTTRVQAPISFARTAITPPVKGTLVGWGRTVNIVDAPPSDDLRTTTVTIINKTDCDTRGNPSLATHLCGFDGKGTGICEGDSGGPLIYNNEIVGIVSFGVSCGIGYPDFYTKVSDYTTFIDNAMKKTSFDDVPS